MDGVEILALAAFAAVMMLLFALKEKRLADPSNHDMIYTDQMQSVLQLPEKRVSAILLRQSGNVYKELGEFESPNAAVLEIQKSFRRAKIESVAVLKNTPDLFHVLRLHHSHGGKSEGKKLGGAAIQTI